MWQMLVLRPWQGAVGTLVFDKLVDMVLGAVLTGGDLKNKCDDQQGLLRVPVGDHLGAGRGDGVSTQPGGPLPAGLGHPRPPAGW